MSRCSKLNEMVWAGLLASVVGLSSCHKAEPPEAARWFPGGYHEYRYDYYSVNDTIAGYRVLKVLVEADYPDELFFDEVPGDTSLDTWERIIEWSGSPMVRKEDGLYRRALKECPTGMGFFTPPQFDYLSIPLEPKEAASIPQYECGYKVVGHNLVLHTDTSIEVPAGRYRCFYLQHGAGDRSYWNRDLGLIMYEQYRNGSLRGVLKLGSWM